MSNTPETDKIFATKHNQPPTHLMEEMRKMEVKINEQKKNIESLKEAMNNLSKPKKTKDNE